MNNNPIFRRLTENEMKLQKSDDKKYLLLLVYNDGVKDFEYKNDGRKATYDYLKLIVENIDVIESKVVSNNINFTEAISVYEFVKFVSSMLDDTYNIDDYVIGDEIYEEKQ